MPGDFGNRGFGSSRGGGYGGGNRGGGYSGGNRGGGFERAPPVKEGEEIDVRIEAVGEKGDGVAKKDGFVLFVPNVNAGDEVRIRITKVLRKVGFAESIGPAEGPVEQAAPPRQQSAAEVKAKELQEVAANAQNIEDSEDFGDEEPAAEEAEAPAEELVEEEPVAEEAEAPVVEDEPVEEPVVEEPVAEEPEVDPFTEPEAPVEEVAEEPVVEEPAEEPAAEPVEEPAKESEDDQAAAIDDEDGDLQPPVDPEPVAEEEKKEL